jgi:hypothetical protein
MCGSVARPQLSCDAEFQYDARKYQGGFSAFGYGVQADSEAQALHQIDQEVERYVAQARRLCDEYNKCVVDRETYATRSENLRRRIAKVPDLYEKVQAAPADLGRRSAIAAAYDALVPDESRVELALEFSLVAKRPGDADFLVAKPGAVLPTDSRVAIVVKPSRTAHVYLFQKNAAGVIQVLFPNPALSMANPLSASSTVRIPNEGSFRVNAEDVGTERVYVVASLQPLSELETGLASLLDGKPAPVVSALSAAAPRADCPHRALDNTPRARGLELAPEPAAPCLRSRGLELNQEPAGAPVSMQMRTEAGDGTVVFAFPFEHVR